MANKNFPVPSLFALDAIAAAEDFEKAPSIALANVAISAFQDYVKEAQRAAAVSHKYFDATTGAATKEGVAAAWSPDAPNQNYRTGNVTLKVRSKTISDPTDTQQADDIARELVPDAEYVNSSRGVNGVISRNYTGSALSWVGMVRG